MADEPTTNALTDLLDSLYVHLHTQTQLLPTFYSQLGLSPGALQDDLKALQEELIKGVERQVQARRMEVEEWISRCDTAERGCIRYSKALGGIANPTGIRVAELKSEMILPRRFELMAEQQGKLRQLYHSKLEQLTTITNRLRSLGRTLGTAFFSMDVLEATAADGENVLDPESYRDVSRERFSRLEKELVRGKAELGKRLSELAGIFVRITWLYCELGISLPTLDELHSGSSSSATQALRPTSPISDPFLLTPTPASRSSSKMRSREESSEIVYEQIFAKFLTRIEEAGDEDLPEDQSVFLENVDPSPVLLAWAKSRQATLEDLRRKRESHIQALYDQLDILWRRLGDNRAELDQFVEDHRGTTEEVVCAYEKKLEEMLVRKREEIGTFVKNAREDIVKLWDDLMIGEDERADFAPFVDGEHSEELLNIHEDEIKRLTEERRLKAPLLANVRRYFDLCKEEKELALAAADQSRLLGRGPRDVGRLLREEKMRKRVLKEKPRLEQDLLISIPAWELEFGRPFLVHGESFLSQLMEAVSAADQENKRKNPRARSVPPRATTPIHSGNASAGTMTPAVRSSSPTLAETLPSKRRKLNHSTTKFYETKRAPLSSFQENDMHTRLRKNTPRSVTLGASVPRTGNRHRVLGHDRVPSTSAGFGLRSVSAGAQGSSMGAPGRSQNFTHKRLPGAGAAQKMASRVKHESFRPRPSTNYPDLEESGRIGNPRWGNSLTSCVKEEEVQGNG